MSYRNNFDPSIYFIADPSLCAGRAITDIVRAALKGGATLIQYRDKDNNIRKISDNARALKEITHEFSVPFLINDYVDVAFNIRADGVHLGQGDMPAEEARQILGHDKIIGQTAFTQEQIQSVDPDITDYLGTGPFYATQTDKAKPVLGAQEFAALIARAPVPVVGIGGITPDNVAAVIQSGAAGVAMMRSISEAENPQESAQQFVQAIQGARFKEAS